MIEATEEHPLLGKHVVLGAMRPGFKYEIEDQVSRLLKMPSSGNDPGFWKVIKWNMIGLEQGYIAVRKLVIGDPVSLIDKRLRMENKQLNGKVNNVKTIEAEKSD